MYEYGHMSVNKPKRHPQHREEQERQNRAIADKSARLSAKPQHLERGRPADRRTARTEKRLREALHALIQEKDYDLIVVKEILDRADVGRSAFYTHFRNKDDLLVSSIREILESVPHPPAKSGPDVRERILWFSLPILEHLEHRRRTGGLRLDGRGRNILHGHVQRVLADLIANECRRDLPRVRSAAGSVPVAVLVQHLAATFILILNWWIESRSPLCASEANDLYRSLVLPAMAGGSR